MTRQISETVSRKHFSRCYACRVAQRKCGFLIESDQPKCANAHFAQFAVQVRFVSSWYILYLELIVVTVRCVNATSEIDDLKIIFIWGRHRTILLLLLLLLSSSGTQCDRSATARSHQIIINSPRCDTHIPQQCERRYVITPGWWCWWWNSEGIGEVNLTIYAHIHISGGLYGSKIHSPSCLSQSGDPPSPISCVWIQVKCNTIRVALMAENLWRLYGCTIQVPRTVTPLYIYIYEWVPEIVYDILYSVLRMCGQPSKNCYDKSAEWNRRRHIKCINTIPLKVLFSY